MLGKVSYYHNRYGLEGDTVLHLVDGWYALWGDLINANEMRIYFMRGLEGLVRSGSA